MRRIYTITLGLLVMLLLAVGASACEATYSYEASFTGSGGSVQHPTFCSFTVDKMPNGKTNINFAYGETTDMYSCQSAVLPTYEFICYPALEEAKLSIPSLVLTDTGGSTLTLSNIKIEWEGYGKIASSKDPITNSISYQRFATIKGSFKTSAGDTIDAGTLIPYTLDGNPICMLTKTKV